MFCSLLISSSCAAGLLFTPGFLLGTSLLSPRLTRSITSLRSATLRPYATTASSGWSLVESSCTASLASSRALVKARLDEGARDSREEWRLDSIEGGGGSLRSSCCGGAGTDNAGTSCCCCCCCILNAATAARLGDAFGLLGMRNWSAFPSSSGTLGMGILGGGADGRP